MFTVRLDKSEGDVIGVNCSLGPENMLQCIERMARVSGVKVVGGCCGTTPAHIKAMRAAIKALQPPPR